jgi:ABC-2 type transport system permease protein
VRRLRLTGEVARWEFRRYVKLKQQVIGFVMFFLMALGGAFLARLGSEPSTIELAVVGAEHLPALPAEADRFRFEPRPADDLPGLRRDVDDRQRTAVLIVQPGGAGELYARQDPGWRPTLARELTAVVQQQRLREAGLDAERLTALGAPFDLEVQEAAPRAGAGARIAAFAALALTLMGLFSGIGYIFSSVTGEKQNRLSEQVISAIEPQTWIDGKIVGLAGVSLVAIVNAVVAGLLFLGAGRLLWGWRIPLPTSVARPDLLLAALLIVCLGFLFWFAVLTAVAAIMDDPHTSNRNQLMFLPVLPMIPAFMAVSDPDATWIRVLGVVPPMSGAVLPVRLLVTEVPWHETAVAVALLLAAIWAVRRIAGKVFRLGMLMYGKEPTWGEVRKWLSEA